MWANWANRQIVTRPPFMGFIGHAGDESGPVPDAARGDPIPRAAGPPRCLLREESTPRPTKEAAGGGAVNVPATAGFDLRRS